MLRRWHRFYTTYPNIGLIRSTNGLDKKEPRTHRLVCRFEDQETDATFVSDRLRKTIAHATSEERPLRHRLFDARDYTTCVEIGKLLAERAIPLRIFRALYGGSVDSFRNRRYTYTYDRLRGIIEGLTSSGIEIEIEVEPIITRAPEMYRNRILYSFVLPLKEVPNVVLRLPNDEVFKSAPSRGKQNPDFTKYLFER
mmetsp:Transcript_37629/g.150069  ORF Transcript_37629/g.150069 Transcript_37629/m.150069 type:complete len:197 (-) Transcript_37629:1636-2226(-)